MSWLTNLMVVIQILAGIAIVGLVLLQQGKGADMGASFGGGSSGSLFGATGSANFLSRSTAVCAAVFFACTLALAFFAHSVKPGETESILDSAMPVASPASLTSASGASAAAVQAPVLPSAVPVPVAVPASASASAPTLTLDVAPIAPAPAASK